MEQHFQGDVMFQKVANLPKNLSPVEPKNGAHILALGEATGHCHSVGSRGVQLLEAPQRTAEAELLNVRFLKIMEGATATVTHREHGPITLTPGIWRVSQQREYAEREIIRVAD